MSDDTPSAEVEVYVPGQLTARGELAQIQAALLVAMDRIPDMATPEAANLWRSADIIRRDLSAIQTDASNRLCAIAPTEQYSYRGETRTRPVKQQVVTGVGMLMIEQSPTRKWADKRALAHDLMGVWKMRYAAVHDGEEPRPNEVIDWLFDIFQIGDPRSTVLKALGFETFDAEPYVAKTFERKARVL